LRHEISNGAVNDVASGYNEYAVTQELHGAKDGNPVPGRNKLPQIDGALDGTIDAALLNPPPEMAGFGAEMTDAVDETMSSLVKGADGKNEAKIWKNLTPEVRAVEKGWQKVLGAISKGWDAIWDTIFWPFKKAWGFIKSLVAKIAKWFGVVAKGMAKGTSLFSRIAAGFVRVFTAVRATKAWKIIKYGAKAYEMWITKVAPMILKHGTKWAGRAVSAVGWATLILDVMDTIQLTDCLTRVNKEGNSPELPKYCQGTFTKMIMGWMGHKMNAAAGIKIEDE
jgi:hypothetical protein